MRYNKTILAGVSALFFLLALEGSINIGESVALIMAMWGGYAVGQGA